MIVEEYTYDVNDNMTSRIYKETDFDGILQNKYKLVTGKKYYCYTHTMLHSELLS